MSIPLINLTTAKFGRMIIGATLWIIFIINKKKFLYGKKVFL